MNTRRFLLILFVLTCADVLGAPLEYRAQVDGLACPFCVYGIEKKLGQIDGVQKIDSDLKKGELRIQMQDGKTLEETQVREAVKSAGFTLGDFGSADDGQDELTD